MILVVTDMRSIALLECVGSKCQNKQTSQRRFRLNSWGIFSHSQAGKAWRSQTLSFYGIFFQLQLTIVLYFLRSSLWAASGFRSWPLRADDAGIVFTASFFSLGPGRCGSPEFSWAAVVGTEIHYRALFQTMFKMQTKGLDLRAVVSRGQRAEAFQKGAVSSSVTTLKLNLCGGGGRGSFHF